MVDDKTCKTKELLEKQNVIGYCEGDDSWNDSNTVTVFVNRKLKMPTIKRKIKDPGTLWSDKDIIPEKVKVGILKEKKTDVIEIGHVKALVDRKRYRPFEPGCEISPVGADFVGTGGAVVTFKKYSTPFRTLYIIGEYASFESLLRAFGLKPVETQGILTNCHVANFNVEKPKVGTWIVQPGARNSGRIGKVIYNIPIKRNKRNEFDVSLIELITEAKKEIIDIGKIKGVREVKLGEKIMKRGRTTNFTEGICKAKNSVMTIDYGPDGMMTFQGVDLFNSMVEGGDSGSIGVAKKDNYAVSHLFAGSHSVSIGVPMPKEQEKLKVIL